MTKLLIMGANNPEILRLSTIIDEDGSRQAARIIGFIDNDPEKHSTNFHGHPVLGFPVIITNPLYHDVCVINNITRDPATRKLTTLQLLNYCAKMAVFVHGAVDTTYVEIGRGTVIHEGCLVMPGGKLGSHCALMPGVQLGHDCHVGDYTFIGPRVTAAGSVTIGSGVSIGAGAIILPRVTIGDDAQIGAGTVVGEDIPAGLFVMGNPARAIPGARGQQ